MLHTYGGIHPNIHPSVFIADGVHIVGDVEIGKDSSVWFNTVIRGDVHEIRIGERTNIQDLSMLHCTLNTHPLHIGNGVTVGHMAMLHGCTVHDYVLVGMQTTILDAAVIGAYSMIAAGTVVKERFVVPEGTLVAGVPGKVVRDLTEAERKKLEQSAQNYIDYVASYRSGTSARQRG
ncbi:MAG TPA: gamma carbonic anhydrase family protein [Chlorobiota bacterium]|nr:gamma carbonic anhydrase family protein [Chlorobiota bacterium]